MTENKALKSLGDRILAALGKPYEPDPEWKKLSTKEKIERIVNRPSIDYGGDWKETRCTDPECEPGCFKMVPKN